MKKLVILLIVVSLLATSGIALALPADRSTQAEIEVIEGESTWAVYMDSTLSEVLPASMELGTIGKGQIINYDFWVTNNGTGYADILVSVEGAAGWADYTVYPAENFILLAPSIKPITVQIWAKVDAGKGVKNFSINFKEQ